MNYIGSKKRLLPFIEETIKGKVGELKDKTFCDLFTGTGAVAKYFKPLVSHVIANDMEFYSYVLAHMNLSELDSKKYIDILSATEGKKGFIYNNYSIGGHGKRLYFSDTNAQLIDGIRQKLNSIKDETKDRDLFLYLLGVLIESADKVANTASVYGAYLKSLKSSAKNPLILKAPNIVRTKTTFEVYNKEANELIKDISGDILYLDPPYNQREYGANYHLLNTIALYDSFLPVGKTGLRKYKRSSFCKRAHVLESFEALIKNAMFKFVFLSYNNEGLMSKEEIKTIMSKHGKYSVVTKTYTRYSSDSTLNRNFKAVETIECIHVLEKNRCNTFKWLDITNK